MDERRIERALREGPPNEPAYRASTASQIDSQTLAAGRTAEDASVGRVRRGGVRARWWGESGGRQLYGTLAAAIALAVIVVTFFSFRAGLAPGASPRPGATDMLSRLQGSGTVRIAVTNQSPQAIAAGGAYIGFDVDVAQALADQLRLRPDIVALAPSEIFNSSASWDIALPSRAVADTTPGFSRSQPYYAWPHWLVVEAGSPISTADQLAGQSICVTTGSTGADWLAGRSVPGVEAAVEPPAGAISIERANEDDCLSAVTSGEAAAAVTVALLDDDLIGRGLRALGNAPILVESRSVWIRGPADDTARLQLAIDAGLAELRQSGRLAEISEGAFGGRDLTQVAP
jgi:ABC-type amino acid transport substrate-binding protein